METNGSSLPDTVVMETATEHVSLGFLPLARDKIFIKATKIHELETLILVIHAMAGGVKLDLPESGVQKVNIDKVLLHEDFNYTLIQNDICLLKVWQTVFKKC